MLDEHSKQRVKDLCNRIANEQDHKQFSILIAQLNDLLEQSDGRPHDGRQNVPAFPKKTL
jgi:hypothetical protein